MPRFLNKEKWGIYVFFTLLFLVGSIYIHEFSRFIESSLWPDSYNSYRRGQYGFPFRENGVNGDIDSTRIQHWREAGRGGDHRMPTGMEGGFNRGSRYGGNSFRSFVSRQFSFMFTLGLTWVISMAYYLFKLLQQSVRHADKVLSSALQSELSFLKAQINPHFLFNTLNNIYVLTLKKSEAAPAAVLKLSNLMRTLTNDTGVDFVSFADEEKFIHDYLELQEMRLTKSTKIVYEVDGDFANLKIAPRILLPFIDNAFKYGVSNRYESEILIRLHFEGNKMQCLIQNAIHREQTENLGSSGVGLGNSKRRLELLYENNYELRIVEKENLHQVFLNIDLS